MMIEIDQVAVKRLDWAAMLQGDAPAKERVRIAINTLTLYAHALSLAADYDHSEYILVDIRAIERMFSGQDPRVVLHIDPPSNG
jgi:hypothetical protein